MKFKWLTMIMGAVLVAIVALVTAPQSALAACSTGVCVRDDFDSRDFTGSDGTKAWGGNWIETGELFSSASSGDILIQTSTTPDYLEFNESNTTLFSNVSWSRCVGTFPADAQAGTIVLKSEIWAATSTSLIDNDRIYIEYSAGPCTSEPGGTWSPAYTNNSDLGQWTAISATLPDTLRGNPFWIRIRGDSLILESGDFHRFNFVEVSYQSPLAVTLDSFEAAADPAGSAVNVAWQTVSETDNQGFNLWRGTTESGPDVKLNDALIPAQNPGSTAGASYTYADAAQLVAGATYYYWLEDVDLNGAVTRHDPVSVTYGAEPNAVGLAGFGAAAGTAMPALAGLGALALAAIAGVAARKRR